MGHAIMSHHILIVDDESSMRYAVRAYLETSGYDVAEVSNGVDALRYISRNKPDLIMLDVMMSPMTGWEVLEVLQANPETREIRVIILTALSHEREEARGWHMGCDWYQIKSKPLQFDDLGLVVDRLLAMEPSR